MAAPTLIAGPAQLTPDWLTAALAAAGVVPDGARITGVRRLPLGGGKVGQNVRCVLTWDRAGLPGSVVAKFPAADERSRRTGAGSDVYRKEVEFYRHIAPHVALAVPRCHLAERNPDNDDFVLLLQDITPARAGDQLAGCSVADAELVLTELARHQARYWGSASLNRFPWLPVRSADGGRGLGAIYRLVVNGFVERFGDRISATALDVVTGFTSRVRPWIRADREPRTLLHGDLRVDNLLFGVDPPVTVVDWQTFAVGPGASDAAYLLGGSLATDARRTHEGELFDTYHQALRAHGVPADRAECWQTYRINTLAGLHMTVVGAMMVGRDDRGDEMFVTMVERHAAHVADLDPFGLL